MTNYDNLDPESILPLLEVAYDSIAIPIYSGLKIMCSDKSLELYNNNLFKFLDVAEANALLITFKDKYNLMVLHEKFSLRTIVHELTHFALRNLAYKIILDEGINNLEDIDKMLRMDHIPDFIFNDDGILDCYGMKRYNYA
jgi:hypothetical protein